MSYDMYYNDYFSHLTKSILKSHVFPPCSTLTRTTSRPTRSRSCVCGTTVRGRPSPSRRSTCSSSTCGDTRARSLITVRYVSTNPYDVVRIRPPLKKKLFPVQRPGEHITADFFFFLILHFFFNFGQNFIIFLPKKIKWKKKVAATRLAIILATRWTGNKHFFTGGLRMCGTGHFIIG